MKTRNLKDLVCTLLIVAAPFGHAGSLYWSGDGTTLGGNGTWDTSNGRWGATAAGPFSTLWDNANNDTAIFSSRIGNTVTLGTGITVGGVQFNITGYAVTGSTLNFGAATNTVTLNNVAAATITSTLSGTGANVIFTKANPASAGTVIFDGVYAGAWTGTTTVNPGFRLEMKGSVNNQALLNTSAITLNGGTIAIGSAAAAVGGSQATLNRINNNATITANGGTIAYDVNNNSANSETVGTLDLMNGQFNLTEAFALSSGSATFIFSGLSRTGAINTSTISLQMKNTALSTSGFQRVVVGGISGNTPAGEIVGPWFSTLYANTSASDYIIYDNGGSGSTYYAVRANIAASGESTWITAANAYTLSALDAATLSGTRNITALRSANNSVTVTANDPNIALASHTLAVGDVVTFSAGTMPTGLTAGTPYYVAAVGSGTFQVSASSSLTPVITPTTAGATVVACGGILLSSGNNLGTSGILNGCATTLNILQSGGAGAVTLPASGSNNLYVTTGSGAIKISAPVQDYDGSTALTMVKSGGNTLTLAGVNTYTGGTVLNAGTLVYTADNQLGASGSRNVTFGGAATLTGFDGSSLNQLTVNSGAVGTISANNITFATTTGSGDIVYASGTKTLNLGDASGFNGSVRMTAGGNGGTVQFSKMGDTVGCGNLQYAGGSGDGGQALTMVFAGNVAPLTLNNRRIEFFSKPFNWSFRYAYLKNNNASVANKLVINTPLANYSDRNHEFILGGTNTGTNEFAGTISDSLLGYMYDGIFNSGNNVTTNGMLSLSKQDVGIWMLSGSNTFSGTTTVSGGTLVLAGSYCLSDTNLLSIAGTGANKVHLYDGVQEVVGLLKTNGVFVANGTYGSTSSTADTKTDTYFTGTGVLYVGITPPPPPPTGTLIQIL